MAKKISIKSLFVGKEMWACNHPKTESFRKVVPDVYRSVNSVYVDLDSVSVLGNWLESDSSSASTSEISSSEDCNDDILESAVEGLVKGLCWQRFFFEPDGSKSIIADNQRKGRDPLSNIKAGSEPERKMAGGLMLLKEKKKVVGDSERETEKIVREVPPLEQDTKPVTAGCCKNEISCHNLLVFAERPKSVNGFSEDGESCNEERTGKTKNDEVLICEVKERQEKAEKGVLAMDETPFEESFMMVMDSEDPYTDFRTSMEETVEAYGLDNWACLEEMLMWYLKVNGKGAHGYIVGAFVDFFLSLSSVRPRYLDQNGEEGDVAESTFDDCRDEGRYGVSRSVI